MAKAIVTRADSWNLVAFGLSLLVLGACAAPEPEPAPTRPPAPPQAHHVAPAVSSRDECRADENRQLIGQPRTRIPVPVYPALQRVVCTTCPVTDDYNPRRLNFLFDAETGLIREVRCG